MTKSNLAYLNRQQASDPFGYRFCEKDPKLYEVLEIIRKSGMTFEQVAEKAGVSKRTLRNWDTGDTRKPMQATIGAVLEACGYSIIYAPVGSRVMHRTIHAVGQ